MKIGLIVECCDGGAETKVIPHVARLIRPAAVPVVVPLRSKRLLKANCGPAAKALMEKSGCQRVLILWDLLPDFNEYEGRGCRRSDKEEIAASLKSAGVSPTDARVQVVCIEKMLESWVLADNLAVAGLLSTPEHPVHVPKCKHPDDVRDPEAALNRSFRETRFRKYRDLDHAFKIIESADLTRLRRSESFRRFEAKLATG